MGIMENEMETTPRMEDQMENRMEMKWKLGVYYEGYVWLGGNAWKRKWKLL